MRHGEIAADRLFGFAFPYRTNANNAPPASFLKIQSSFR